MVNSVNLEDRPKRRVGVIDVGSNSVLLLVLASDGTVVSDESHITRLGEGLESGQPLGQEPGRRTERVVIELARRARHEGADPVVAVGTDALRRAGDGDPFLDRLAVVAGLDSARILTGEEEAAFAVEASRRESRTGGRVVVVDVGGGSTEVAWIEEEGGVGGLSLPLGSVRLTERFIRSDPPSAAETRAVREAARDVLAGRGLRQEALRLGATLSVTAVAGTATTLAALDQRLERYDPERVEGYSMGREDLERWVDRLVRLELAERRALPGMEPGRADILAAGLIILAETLGALGAGELRVSGRGVRYGVALRLLDTARGVW